MKQIDLGFVKVIACACLEILLACLQCECGGVGNYVSLAFFQAGMGINTQDIGFWTEDTGYEFVRVECG